jgi:hypothetical protein
MYSVHLIKLSSLGFEIKIKDKIVSVANHHEGIWGRELKLHPFLRFGTHWKCVVSYMLHLHWIGHLVAKRKTVPLLGIEPSGVSFCVAGCAATQEP